MKQKTSAEICCIIIQKLLPSIYCSSLLNSFVCKIFEKIIPFHIYKIQSESKYANRFKSKVFLLKKDRIGISASAISNLSLNKDVVINEEKLPDLYLYSHKNVIVSSCSDHIININERLIINDYLANKNDDNKTYYDYITRTFFRDIAFLRKKNLTRYIDCGIKIFGKYSFNYYHAVYENLIRLLLLQEFNDMIPTDVPIIIDEDTIKIPSLNQILKELTKDLKRKIEVIKIDELVEIGDLWSFTPINQFTPNYKNSSLSKDTDQLFDREYTLKMRNKLLLMKSNKDFPTKLFITRKNTNRRNFNEDDVFSVLEPYGFIKIAPEEFTLEEQIQMFHNAQWIVSGSGAALTNLIFCQSYCNVLCLLGRSGHIQTCFTTPAFFNHAKMHYYQQENENIVGVHSNFHINVEKFNKYFKSIIES